VGLSSRAIRATAWAVVAAGVAAPVVRKRVKAPPLVLQSVAFAAPIGLSVAMRRSRTRDVAVCGLQMWAYVSAYKAPHDNEQRQSERVHIDYPIYADELLGLGRLPTVRLQEAFASPDRWRRLDKMLVWTHWAWFVVPHSALAWILWRRRERFPRAAAMTYAVFDIGACLYWIVPTAPPWYAASVAGRMQLGGEVAVRRMMAEYGEFFWKDGWGPLYSVFGGNPVAAMPSLHFATSLMAALLLAETGPIAGALGFGYAATLGFALIYLGEHYAIDLVGGAALAMLVRREGFRVGPLLRRFGDAVAALEARAAPEGLGAA
jgi:membrane-associated phospholipid phosphatase